MKNIICCLLGLTVAARADSLALGHNRDKVAPVVPLKVWAFPLEDVRLLDGPFHHAMDLDGAYLLALDTDRLVRNFRINAGLPAPGEPLGGWEAPDCELRGHFVGHYMSACAQMFAATGDARYKEKGEAVVKALGECQEKLGSGIKCGRRIIRCTRSSPGWRTCMFIAETIMRWRWRRNLATG